MTRNEWVDLCGYVLEMYPEVQHFSPDEIANLRRFRVVNGTKVYQKAPGPTELRNAIRLAIEVLEWVRADPELGGPAPVSVSSWYRDEEYNRAVGGGRASVHMMGAAADIRKAGVTPRQIALRLHRGHHLSSRMGIGLYNSFVHVDIRGLVSGMMAPARWGPGSWWV
jgi:hypothetical protein